MKKELLPEKKLLEHIRLGSSQPGEARTGNKKLPVLLKKTGTVIRVLFEKIKTRPYRYISMFLAAGLLLNLFLIYIAMTGETPDKQGPGPAVKVAEYLKPDKNKEMSRFYEELNTITAKNIFRPLIQVQPERKKEPELPTIIIPPAPPEPTIRELSTSLKLLGIIPDTNPQAIIEDLKEKRTYYLEKGQFLGKLKVREVLENKVIFSYKEEEISLNL